MRILYVNQFQGPELIAARGIVRNRALGGNRKIEVLSDLVAREGHEIVLISGGMPSDRTLRWSAAFEGRTAAGGARVLYASGFDAPYLNLAVCILSSVRIALREARRSPFDLIIVYNVNELSMAVVAALRSRFGRVPFVLEYEDAVDMSSRGVGPIRRWLWRRFESWVHPRVTGVLAVNDSLRQRMGCDNSYVLRGLVSDHLCDLGAARNPPLGQGPPFIAFYAGSFGKEKGLRRLIEIVPRFAGRIRFVVAGAGPLKSELLEASRRWPNDLEVRGFLPREELDAMLVGADILLNPHDDESGGIFPFKVIEYLASGGAVVTTHCGMERDEALGFCETVSPQTFGDGIERLLMRSSAAAARAAEGQRWTRDHYSESAVAERVGEVIARAVPMAKRGGY